MDPALAAAHNVDVGDFNFKEKNYRGAFMRYRDALEPAFFLQEILVDLVGIELEPFAGIAGEIPSVARDLYR